MITQITDRERELEAENNRLKSDLEQCNIDLEDEVVMNKSLKAVLRQSLEALVAANDVVYCEFGIEDCYGDTVKAIKDVLGEKE